MNFQKENFTSRPVLAPVARESLEFDLKEATQVGQVRRAAILLAENLGFDENSATRVGIVVNELATNILKHAKTGQMILNRDTHGLEILALDHGPGINNLGESMRDGHSTAGTSGTGLGAVTRQSDEYDFYSSPMHGTIAYARFGPSPEPQRIRIGGVCLRLSGESACGDGWQAAVTETSARVAIVDGLGHGPAAAQAAARALDLFEELGDRQPAALLKSGHTALRSTRGAAMGVARVDFAANVVTYGGVGNTVAMTVNHGEIKRMISYEGALGVQARKFQELAYPFTRPSLLILHTDGISTSWDLAKYPGISYRHPAIISALILREHRRGRDDATVVTLSWRPEE